MEGGVEGLDVTEGVATLGARQDGMGWNTMYRTATVESCFACYTQGVIQEGRYGGQLEKGGLQIEWYRHGRILAAPALCSPEDADARQLVAFPDRGPMIFITDPPSHNLLVLTYDGPCGGAITRS